jgi:hypothetical protein
MIDFFGKGKSNSQKETAVQPRQQQAIQQKPQHTKAAEEANTLRHEPEGFYDFQRKVFAVKAEVINSIENMDKQGAIDKLIVLSNLSATAIYDHNLREIVVVDEAISDIKKTIDTKLASLKTTSDGKITPEGEYYTLIRLSMIPVCSMLSVLDMHTSTAISHANEEIDGKIQELQRFLVEYETQLVKSEVKKARR